MKYVILDTETTGLRAYYHEIVSFCGIKIDKDLREIERLTLKISPSNPERADPEAIKINGYSSARWRGAISPDEAAPMIAEFMRDCTPVAHNWAFDRGFILALFKSVGRNDLKIMRRGIDTIALSIAAFGRHGVKSFSLDHIGRMLGWPRQKHRAEADAVVCLALFRLLYPAGIRTAAKIHLIVYYAKIRGIINPYNQLIIYFFAVGGVLWQI